jgi:hypothetical protein
MAMAPAAHAALIEQVGPQRYSEQFELDQRNRVIARVGGLGPDSGVVSGLRLEPPLRSRVVL